MSEAPDVLDWQQDFMATNLLVIGYNDRTSDSHRWRKPRRH